MRPTRISLLLVLASLSCRLILNAQEMSPQAQALASRAVQLQSSGEYGEAATAYKQLLQMVPNDVATHVNLGVVLVNLGRFDEAIGQYDAAEALLPNDPRIGLNRALAYEKSGRLPEAEKQFFALYQANPADPKYTMLLADCESQLGNDDRVIELLRPIYSAGTTDSAVAYMLGTALLHKGKNEEGERVLDPLLRDGNTAGAHFLLGLKAFESGDYPGAVSQFAGAVAINSRLPGLQSFYGRALLNTGDPVAASAAYKEALKVTPNDFWANLQLGQIFLVKRQFASATPLLERALSVRPESAESKLALAQALLGEGQAAQARPLAESAVALLPKSIEAHKTLQSVYTELHLPALARDEGKKTGLLARADEADGPHLNDLAPDFTLPSNQTGKEFSVKSYHAKSPLVLIFGSYSCPNFRSAAEALKAMGERYRSNIPFFLVYIREAHAAGQWQSTRNERESVEVTPAKTYAEKQEHAAMCSLKLHLPFPALVDGMDGKVENLYHAWPSRAFVIGEDGKVLYSSRLTELDFHPAEMESVLKRLVRSTRLSANR